MVDGYLALLRGSFRSQRAYPLSFVLLMASSLLATSLDFAAIAVIFGRLSTLGGFTLPEVALLYGLAGVSFALTDLAVGSVDVLPDLIRQGTFDTILIRPLGALFQVAASEVALRRLGKLAQSSTILVVALTHLPIEWTPARVVAFGMVFVTGPVLFGSVWVAALSHVFWTVDSGEAANAFYFGGNVFSSYPIDIFGRWLRDLLAFVIPLSFVAYYPALFLLGRSDPLGLPAFMPLLTPAVAVAALLAARLAWTAGVRHYQGTGS